MANPPLRTPKMANPSLTPKMATPSLRTPKTVSGTAFRTAAPLPAHAAERPDGSEPQIDVCATRRGRGRVCVTVCRSPRRAHAREISPSQCWGGERGGERWGEDVPYRCARRLGGGGVGRASWYMRHRHATKVAISSHSRRGLGLGIDVFDTSRHVGGPGPSDRGVTGEPATDRAVRTSTWRAWRLGCARDVA